MPTFEHTIDVAAPREQVFEFGTDPTNWQRTTPNLRNVDVGEQTDDGFRLTATWKMLGMSMDGDMEFEIVEPNEHTVTRFESPGMTGELHYHYSDNGDGTTVVQRADYEFGDSVVQRIMKPVATRYNERQFKNSLKTTKELIEAEAAVPA